MYVCGKMILWFSQINIIGKVGRDLIQILLLGFGLSLGDHSISISYYWPTCCFHQKLKKKIILVLHYIHIMEWLYIYYNYNIIIISNDILKWGEEKVKPCVRLDL
jgi:hypothetical protein